jgi:hypothetical protein
VAVDPDDPTSGLSATFALLGYSVFATNDASGKLGDRPFDNCFTG